MLASHRFIGQRLGCGHGLYFYNARYCDPGLARFIQPDTLVPSPGDPQSLNRYSYAGNNPLRYVDPSGHSYCVDDECDLVQRPHSRRMTARRSSIHYYVKAHYNVTIENGFSPREESAILSALHTFSGKTSGETGVRKALGGVIYRRMPRGAQGTSHYEGGIVFLHDSQLYQSGYRAELGPEIAIIHESAHAWSDKAMPLIPGVGLDLLYAHDVANEVPPTAYAHANFAEHWAESVAMGVYPEYETILRNENHKEEMQLGEYYQPDGSVSGIGRGPSLGHLHRYWLDMFFGLLSSHR